jgi:multiple sugar transport system ATP-binding protein
VKVAGLRKRFDATTALDGVDLEVGDDELLVVLGPTGAGKTTLLRCIAGLETPDAGAVEIAGREVTRLAPAERDVALVFQNFSLYPRWTVRRNLEFPLRAPGRDLGGAEISARVDWAAELLRIGPLLDKPASRLSGGEMQRVAIGRAIVRRPRLFLMDEPLTNLDAKLRESLRVELVELRRRLKTPMIFVTHDQAEALSTADRIVVLARGRVLQTGTPEEIYRRPATAEVARQVGQPAINLLSAASLGLGGVELVGVRPEDIAIEGGEVEGEVRIVEDMGPVKTLLVGWRGTEIHIVAPKSASVRATDRVRPKVAMDRVVRFQA